MEKFFQMLQDQSERFTHSEIRAEILRQQIQELEEKARSEDEHAEEIRELRIKSLKNQLELVKHSADLSSQGRSLLVKNREVLNKSLESNSVPPETDDLLKETRKWMDAMEFERDVRDKVQLRGLRRQWPVANWPHRVHMLGWLGKYTIRRFVVQKPLFYTGRAVMGLAMMAMRK